MKVEIKLKNPKQCNGCPLLTANVCLLNYGLIRGGFEGEGDTSTVKYIRPLCCAERNGD